MYKHQNVLVNFSQKKYTCKNNITYKKLIHTSTVGTVMRYLKIIKYKYLRRSLKGFKIFLNLIKSIFLKKIFQKGNTNTIIYINSFSYNMNCFKKKINSFFEKSGPEKKFYFLINLKLSFSKSKDKKIKSIKRRIKKKILLSFLKKNIIKKYNYI